MHHAACFSLLSGNEEEEEEGRRTGQQRRKRSFFNLLPGQAGKWTRILKKQRKRDGSWTAYRKSLRVRNERYTPDWKSKRKTNFTSAIVLLTKHLHSSDWQEQPTCNRWFNMSYITRVTSKESFRWRSFFSLSLSPSVFFSQGLPPFLVENILYIQFFQNVFRPMNKGWGSTEISGDRFLKPLTGTYQVFFVEPSIMNSDVIINFSC